MFASLAFAALASVAVARPIGSAVDAALSAVNNALVVPTGTHTSNVAYFWQNGNAGACGLYSEDTDLVVGLPLEFYNDTGSVSSYCGSYVVITNPLNNETVTSRIADASATENLLSLSIQTWRNLNGDGTNLANVTWHFANSTEEAAAKAALSSAAFTQTTATSTSSSYQTTATSTSSPAAAKTTTTSSAQTTIVAAAVEYTTSSKTTTTTTKAYVAPTTTTTQKPYTTTTTQKPYTTTTTLAAATTTKTSSSKSSSSGTYSGQATYFYQNGVAGACGSVHSDSDYIVALDSAMYGSGSYCGKSLTITGNGKSVTATVADECPTCASSGSLDLSVAAFNAIASESDGVASITWSWN